MTFPKDADYAVRILLFLAMAESGKHQETATPEEYHFVSTSLLAKELGIPLNFLRRICTALVKAKILDTREGKNGGVKLKQPPQQITVAAIIETVHGRQTISRCTFRKKLCKNRKTCVLRRRLLQIENKMRSELEKITIQTLIDDLRSVQVSPPIKNMVYTTNVNE